MNGVEWSGEQLEFKNVRIVTGVERCRWAVNGVKWSGGQLEFENVRAL